MSGEAAEDVASLLLSLELWLMDPDLRRDRSSVSALLAEDFREFGSSGRAWDREAILDLLTEETGRAAPVVEDFAVCQLAGDVFLATYRTVRPHPEKAVLRSSIWVRGEDGWRIVFHQGTKIP